MFRRSMTALALAACTFAPLASFAAPSDNNANVAPAKGPMIHVTLKNRSNVTQNLTVEGRTITLAANAEYKLAAPAGTEVLGADNTVKLTLVRGYDGAVCSFR